MPKPRKEVATPPPPDDDRLDRLIEGVEGLRGEVQVLREILDRLHDDFAWALNNDCFRCTPTEGPRDSVQVTNTPVDPCDEDGAEGMNRCTPEDLPAQLPPAPTDASPAQQRELWG